MSREIEFRGKRTYNGERVYGCLTRYSETVSYITIDLIDDKVYEVDTKTVGQYTGLKDKNGNKIFEGDIVSSYGLVDDGVVCFGRFTQKGLNCEGRYVLYDRYIGENNGEKKYEQIKESLLDRKRRCNENYSIVESNDILNVKGNIYENPEFLSSLQK